MYQIITVVGQIIPTLLYLYIYYTHFNISSWKYEVTLVLEKMSLPFYSIPVIYITLLRTFNKFHGIMQQHIKLSPNNITF